MKDNRSDLSPIEDSLVEGAEKSLEKVAAILENAAQLEFHQLLLELVGAVKMYSLKGTSIRIRRSESSAEYYSVLCILPSLPILLRCR